MTTIRVLASRVVDRFRRDSRERRLAEEVRAHLDLLTDEQIARGLSPADARLAARKAFGGVDQVKARYRDQRGVPWLDAFAVDLRSATRAIRRDWSFSGATIIALALGMSVSTLAFTVIYCLYLRPLPFDNPGQVVVIRGEANRTQGSGIPLVVFDAWQSTSRSFSGLAVHVDAPAALGDDVRATEQVGSTFVSDNMLGLLGVRPSVGRDFRPDDNRPGAPNVVIVSHTVWTVRYGSDSSVIGHEVRVDGQPATVIGVAPRGFRFPTESELWRPLAAWPAGNDPNPEQRPVRIVGRLVRGVSIDQARAELSSLVSTLATVPPSDRTRRTIVVPLNEGFHGRVTDPAPLVILSAGSLVLLIACAHAASLLLARSVARAREMSLRAALGAGRGRVVRQLLLESVLISMAAGAIGLALASTGVRMFADETRDFGMPYWTNFGFDARLFALVAMVSLLVGVVFSLMPALHISKPNLSEMLNQAGRTGATGAHARRRTAVLLVAELAVTIVLLAGAGLLLQSARVLYQADQSIDVARLWEYRLQLPSTQYPTSERRTAFYDHLNERLAAASGFSSAALASVAPFLASDSRPVLMDAETLPVEPTARTARVVMIGDRYFETLGLRLLRGRGVEQPLDSSAGAAALVNEQFAALFSPGQDPIGRRIGLVDGRGLSAQPEYFTITGIAPPIRQSPASGQQAIVYLPHRGREGAAASIILRGDPEAFAEVLRQQVRAIDPDLPLYGLQSLARLSEKSRFAQRASSTLFTVFAVVAVALTSLGLYAVTAYNATQRRQEIGVRMALGASRSQVTWLFLRAMLRQLSLALTLGVIGALGAGSAIRSLLIQTDAADPVTLVGVCALVVVVSVAATLLPTRRATRDDPLVALRHD